MSDDNRSLTDSERRLALWMLQHGEPGAAAFIDQLDRASVTAFRCPCGCASINFKIEGFPEAPPGVHPIGDYVFGPEGNVNGIFIFESQGILSGIEVYGLEGEAPQALPAPEELRPWADADAA